MGASEFLKSLSYRNSIRWGARSLHLQRFLRNQYYAWARPADGIVHFEVGGIGARFYVRTPGELRVLDPAGRAQGEHHILELLIATLRPGDVVYDVGANVGLYSAIVAKAVGPEGKVFAFEPNSTAYEHFLENIEANGLSNVRCFQKALGERGAQAKLYRGEQNADSSLICSPTGVDMGYEFVEVVEGDKLAESEKLPVPRLVKVDVEGSEYAVLRGLGRTLGQPACEVVCCEIHPHLLPQNVVPEDVLTLLKSLGFSRINIRARRDTLHALCFKESSQLREEKRRILVSAFACQPSAGSEWVLGGGEDQLGWNLVKQVCRFFRVWVLTSAQNRAAIEEASQCEPLTKVRFHYVELPRWLRPLKRYQGGIQLYAYLWQVKAYFVARRLHRHVQFHAFHHITYANDWMASFIGALLPVPYIRGPGGGAHRSPKDFLREYSLCGRLAEHFRAIGQWVFRHDLFFIMGQRRARALLVCNREALEAIPRKWRTKAHLFPVNGVSRTDLALSESAEAPNHSFRVLTAGKLLSIKGFSLAIRAFKAFLEQRAALPGISEARFTIIGDGPERAHLEALVRRLGLERQVAFGAWMPREQLLATMASHDVFLFPSLRDGGGAVVVEAMAAGKPVICLDLAGPGMHVADACGIKVPANSPEQAVSDMARALDRLYTDKELRHRMGTAGRERAKKLYHWDRLGERLLEIYTDVLQVKPSGVNTHANDESIAAAAGQRRTSF